MTTRCFTWMGETRKLYISLKAYEIFKGDLKYKLSDENTVECQNPNLFGFRRVQNRLVWNRILDDVWNPNNFVRILDENLCLKLVQTERLLFGSIHKSSNRTILEPKVRFSAFHCTIIKIMYVNYKLETKLNNCDVFQEIFVHLKALKLKQKRTLLNALEKITLNLRGNLSPQISICSKNVLRLSFVLKDKLLIQKIAVLNFSEGSSNALVSLDTLVKFRYKLVSDWNHFSTYFEHFLHVVVGSFNWWILSHRFSVNSLRRDWEKNI